MKNYTQNSGKTKTLWNIIIKGKLTLTSNEKGNILNVQKVMKIILKAKLRD